jgi:hypothetical protein
MRKALASVIIIAFTGLLTTSLLVMFSDTSLANHYIQSQALQFPYFVAY